MAAKTDNVGNKAAAGAAESKVGAADQEADRRTRLAQSGYRLPEGWFNRDETTQTEEAKVAKAMAGSTDGTKPHKA